MSKQQIYNLFLRLASRINGWSGIYLSLASSVETSVFIITNNVSGIRLSPTGRDIGFHSRRRASLKTLAPTGSNRHPSKIQNRLTFRQPVLYFAEGVGFEPTRPFRVRD